MFSVFCVENDSCFEVFRFSVLNLSICWFVGILELGWLNGVCFSCSWWVMMFSCLVLSWFIIGLVGGIDVLLFGVWFVVSELF